MTTTNANQTPAAEQTLEIDLGFMHALELISRAGPHHARGALALALAAACGATMAELLCMNGRTLGEGGCAIHLGENRRRVDLREPMADVAGRMLCRWIAAQRSSLPADDLQVEGKRSNRVLGAVTRTQVHGDVQAVADVLRLRIVRCLEALRADWIRRRLEHPENPISARELADEMGLAEPRHLERSAARSPVRIEKQWPLANTDGFVTDHRALRRAGGCAVIGRGSASGR